MCLSPILIKNVNYGNKSSLAYLSDTTSQYIPVPCGRCSVCIALKQQYIVQRVQMESLSHDLYFGTLTYNDECIPSCEYGDFKLYYPDIRDWQCMIKMIRKHENLPQFRYLLVSEYGGRKHRPHFHFILSFPHIDSYTERLNLEYRLRTIFLKYWRRNIGSTRKPIWKDLCTYTYKRKSYNYDLHYLNPWSSQNGLDDVAFYVTKYVLKFDPWLDKLKSKLFFNLSESDYKSCWDCIRPRRLMSKGFGAVTDPKVIDHITLGVNMSLDDSSALFPYFVSPVNGKTFPLSPYYSKKFLSIDQVIVLNSRKKTLTDYDMMLDSRSKYTPEQVVEKERKFNEVRDYLSSINTHFDEDTIISNLYLYGNTTENLSIRDETSFSWQDSDFDDYFTD